MILNKRHLYHPFLDSNLGFLVQAQAFGEENETNVGFVVEEIDLYYQPVQEPTVGVTFHLCRILLVGIGEFIHVKIWRMLKEENGLVKEVTSLYTLTVMFVCPFWSLFTASTDFIHPMSEVIGKWYCTVGFAINYFCWNIISFHSFIVAAMRYLFIVHEDQVNHYGKDRVKRAFLGFYLILSITVLAWGAGREVDAMSFINKCYGKDHKVFLMDTSTVNVAGRNFCALEDYDYNESVTTWAFSWIRRLSCIATTTIMLLMGFNIFEGFLYFNTLTHIYR